MIDLIRDVFLNAIKTMDSADLYRFANFMTDQYSLDSGNWFHAYSSALAKNRNIVTVMKAVMDRKEELMALEAGGGK